MVGRGKGGLEAAGPIFLSPPSRRASTLRDSAAHPFPHRGTSVRQSPTEAPLGRLLNAPLQEWRASTVDPHHRGHVRATHAPIEGLPRSTPNPPPAEALYPRHFAGREGRTPLNASDPPPSAVSSYSKPLLPDRVIVLRPFPSSSLAASTCGGSPHPRAAHLTTSPSRHPAPSDSRPLSTHGQPRCDWPISWHTK